MKYSGNAGFRITDVEVEPDVFEPQVVVKKVRGDVVTLHWQTLRVVTIMIKMATNLQLITYELPTRFH